MHKLRTSHLISAFLLTLLGATSAAAQALNPAPDDPPAAAAAVKTEQPPAEDHWFFPFAIINANANFNAKTLVPGSIAYFAAPDLALNTGQFNISAGNSVFGADMKFPKVSDFEVNAKVDLDLRGTSPIENQNVYSPLFGDVYLEFRNQDWRVLFGQTVDVISPLAPTTLNTYPWSYTPGSLGFFRPQIRVESYYPMGDDRQLTVQGALSSAIQTFNVSGQATARQSGWPDGQLRVAYGIGKQDARGSRPTEFGAWGHFGRRDLTYSDLSEHFRNTYSIGFDGRAKIGTNTSIQGELFFGQLLGDYMGAVFQNYNPDTGQSVAAKGGWLEVEQKVAEAYKVHVGYGVDNVDEKDVSTLVSRTQNGVLYGNVFYNVTPALAFAGEISLWRTQYFAQPTATPTRLEFSVIYSFFGR
jgi:hypothetical protein